MSFDWEEYLNLARFLLNQAGTGCTTEAACRGAVSKAYYAAFNYARNYATDYLGFVSRSRPDDRAQDHGRLRAHFRQRRRQRVGDLLGKLREWRDECDYLDDLMAVSPLRRATDAVTAAEYVINALPPPAHAASAAGS